MRTCYNYLVFDDTCYRIDLNSGEVLVSSVVDNGVVFPGEEIFADSHTGLCRKLNYSNIWNSNNDVNCIEFISPVYNSGSRLLSKYGSVRVDGSIPSMNEHYDFCGLGTVVFTLANRVPAVLRVSHAASMEEMLSSFVRNAIRYKQIYLVDRSRFSYCGIVYDLTDDNVTHLFGEYRLPNGSNVMKLRYMNVLFLALEYQHGRGGVMESDVITVLPNGDLKLSDDVFELRRNGFGRYYITGPTNHLFKSSDHDVIARQIRSALPAGERRIGVFPEFDSVDALYMFIERLTGLKLDKDVHTEI